jgi:hypothetical protein
MFMSRQAATSRAVAEKAEMHAAPAREDLQHSATESADLELDADDEAAIELALAEVREGKWVSLEEFREKLRLL